MVQWQCRVSPTLGELESTHQKVWRTRNYIDDSGPAVFFGLYGLPDFYALWRHKGEKHILWAGTDILHFTNGYWLDTVGSIKLSPKPLATWIQQNCTSWVENEVEERALLHYGIKSTIVPSFLGDIDHYPLSYRPSLIPKVYASVSGNEFKKYGWNQITDLAIMNPSIEFHLYGNTIFWQPQSKNVIVHGRVSKQQMNSEVQHMQGALRLVKHDGFSEILAKSILWGQWPISTIPYPHMLKPYELATLSQRQEPNIEGREYYRKTLNQYPWII